MAKLSLSALKFMSNRLRAIANFYNVVLGSPPNIVFFHPKIPNFLDDILEGRFAGFFRGKRALERVVSCCRPEVAAGL